mmetsp:Transcript_19445/g.61154  ORF Transcript_19445/g.61154 Transcript_19445/m.61154 type:complete len:735 (-) Transcript_19445:268-2472(-)
MGGSQLWQVVGGADKGGIIVRTGKDATSEICGDRLSTGAVVEEVSLDGERLCFRRLAGIGPSEGWVSTRLPQKELMQRLDNIWEIVGGADKGGIFVRQGLDTASPACSERLSTGAFVRELEPLQGLRLHYARLTGTGPDEGWVSIRLESGKELVRKLEVPEPPPEPEQFSAPWPAERLPYEGDVPLDIRLYNEEKDFSYEGYPEWVPTVAAIARLYREGKPFMPYPVETPARVYEAKPLAPFKKFKPKELRENTKLNLPGCMFDLPLPKTAEEMRSDEFGADWLTRAFHAAGTLAKDNRVAKLLRAQELPVKGFDAAGGAAMKMFLTVEYERQDPGLHTELFAKYPYLYEEYPSSRQEVSGYNDVDGPEITCAMRLVHLFPFRTAKFYFCDVCRETTNWILITETIPFAKRGRVENGKVVEHIEYKPYEVLPVCGKYQDWLLPDPAEFYCCLFRTMGRLAAWDKLGRYDAFLGPSAFYNEQEYLGFTKAGRQTSTQKLKEMTQQSIGKMMDSGIDFVMNVVNNMVPEDIKDMAKLNKLKSEMIEMSPYFNDMSSYFQPNNTDYQAAMHANLQADNAFFWRDEFGDLSCGVLDWGGFARTPFAMNFMGCLSGADPEVMLAHEEGIVRCFIDEYFRSGGPKLDLADMLLRYRLAWITFCYDSTQWIERDIYKQMPKAEIAKCTGVLDENFQAAFRVRCRGMTVINAFTFYIMKGHFKALFDEWASGRGRPYLTEYK